MINPSLTAILGGSIQMKSLVCGIFAASLVVPASAMAATLSIVGGTLGVLSSDYDPAPTVTGFGPGSSVTMFEAATDGGSVGGGLYLSDAAALTITFMGKEASAMNTVMELVDGGTIANTDAAGTAVAFLAAGAGAVDFSFQTTGIGDPTIFNAGISEDVRLRYALSEVTNGGSTVFAFFDDGRADRDYDDMVVRIDIASAPLPAGVVLIGTAMAGFGVMRARRKGKAKAA